MKNGVMGLVGHAGAKGRVGRLKRGLRLFRSPYVPFSSKLSALAIGVGGTIALFLLEAPLEGVLAMLLPGFGLVADFAVDGLEIFLLPVVLTLLFLPSLVPSNRRAETLSANYRA